MSGIDWIVLASTLLLIVLYGVYRSRGSKSMDAYLLGDREMPWYNVGLSVMATQASAITFLSAPGQGFTDGTRFVQFYFGLPIAMLVLCITFIPIFHRLKVYTAYEFLEQRFDVKTRTFTAILFLIQRGVSTGITIYAPSIILSTILGVSQIYTTAIISILVIIYTVYGGTKAVSYTHLLQMLIIFSAMFLAGYMIVHMLPEGFGFSETYHLAEKLGKINTIDTKFDLNNRYNVWSGLIGGFFLALSYFGTDQSQVGRYLAGKSIKESRMGLIMNGIVKIPMQFLILLIGALLVVFYQFYEAPVYFNDHAVTEVKTSIYAKQYDSIENAASQLAQKKASSIHQLSIAYKNNSNELITKEENSLLSYEQEYQALRKKAKEVITASNTTKDSDDSNYVFLNFVMHYLPKGLIGLIIAVIFLASMGSTASGLSSLASTSVVDIYKRLVRKEDITGDYVKASRWLTVAWGLFCMFIAFYAGKLGNLIEAVNILGSLFYGTILGIFVVAFYFKKIKANAVFYGAAFAEIIVCVFYWLDLTAFLWLNVIGCLLVVLFASIIQVLNKKEQLN
jgi:solute:Na+ symporter, SSS family